jgi:hypothetical protein
MTFEFSKWIEAYGNVAPDESIKYKDDSGTWREETDYQLNSISSELQRRGYIYQEELREIGKWKAGGRINHHLKQNDTGTVKRQSELAFRASGDEESIEELTELKGVSVPVASTILAMFDPSSFAVVDYRAFRALRVTKPNLLDSTDYSRYVEYMNHFLNYRTNTSAYSFYINEVRNLAQKEGLLPREVDMALWAYDKSMT